MSTPLSQPIVKKIWRALAEFAMLEPEDKVLIGYSGGKDSLFLAYALSELRGHLQFPLQIAAVHIDLGFGLDLSSHHSYFQELEIPLFVVPTQISTLLAQPNRQNPCSRCAYFRRGALKKFALQGGFNKIALAHHNDDAVETLLLSLIYSGQIKTLAPKTVWDQAGLTIIRPLIYLREYYVNRAAKALPVKPHKNPCPYSQTSKRGEIKELIRQLTYKNPTVYSNLASCLRAGRPIDLWPQAPSAAELKERFAKFASATGTARDEDDPQG